LPDINTMWVSLLFSEQHFMELGLQCLTIFQSNCGGQIYW